MPTTAVQSYHGSYVMPSLEHAIVSDAMHPGLLTCEPDTSVTEVARIMATHHVHCVAVMRGAHDQSHGPYLWGIVSDLDLVRAGVGAEAEETAGALAQQATITVTGALPLREAAELMLRHRTSHLVVIHPGTQRPLGVLSTLDIAGVLAWGEG